MARRGSDNLRYYLSHAVLPQMIPGVGAPEIPPEGHKSHRNTLSVRPESYRKLQSIYQLKDRDFHTLMLKCESKISLLVSNMCLSVRALGIDCYIPFEPFGVEDEDETTGERLSVPASACCDVPPMPLNRPSEISWYVIVFYRTLISSRPSGPQGFRMG